MVKTNLNWDNTMKCRALPICLGLVRMLDRQNPVMEARASSLKHFGKEKTPPCRVPNKFLNPFENGRVSSRLLCDSPRVNGAPTPQTESDPIFNECRLKTSSAKHEHSRVLLRIVCSLRCYNITHHSKLQEENECR